MAEMPSSLSWNLAFAQGTEQQAGRLAKLVKGLNRITTSPPDAYCMSGGAVACVKTLGHKDVKYGTIELMGYPWRTEISPDMRANANRILNFWSDSDSLLFGIIKGHPIEGATNIHRLNIEHPQWNDEVLDGRPNALIKDFVSGFKGEQLRSETTPDVLPSKQSDDPGFTRCPPFCPPFDWHDGGGGGGGGVCYSFAPNFTTRAWRGPSDPAEETT
jgi:hypothetical protein